MSAAIDIVRMAYSALFNVEFNLEGCKDDLNPFIKVTPDVPTLELFRIHKMMSKKAKSSTIGLIEVIPTDQDKGKPKSMIADGAVFRFEVKMTSEFIRKTHLATYDFDANVILLSNRSNLSNRFIDVPDLVSRSSMPGLGIARDTVALIELYNVDTLPAGYQLFDGSSKCKEPIYVAKLHPFKII